MSVEAFEAREKRLTHRAKVLEAEHSRLSGQPAYSVSDVRKQLQERYENAHAQGLRRKKSSTSN